MVFLCFAWIFCFLIIQLTTFKTGIISGFVFVCVFWALYVFQKAEMFHSWWCLLQELDQTGWRRSRGISSSAPSTGTSVSHLETEMKKIPFFLWFSLTFLSSSSRNSTAERSSLLSNRPRGDLTTLSILILSSQLKPPEVRAATLPRLLFIFAL